MNMTLKFHRMEIYGGPDRQGRCHYALFWMARHPGDLVAGIASGEWRERGQHFFFSRSFRVTCRAFWTSEGADEFPGVVGARDPATAETPQADAAFGAQPSSVAGGEEAGRASLPGGERFEWRSGQTRRTAMIEVKRTGTMEVRKGKRVRIVDAYAVFVDGKERQPWLQKRAALAEVKRAAIAELDQFHAAGGC